MGLNESYDNFKSKVWMIVPVPNVNQSYAMIINVESESMNNAHNNSSFLEIHWETALMSNRMFHCHHAGNGSYQTGSSRTTTSITWGNGEYSTCNGNGNFGGFRKRNFGDWRNAYLNGKSHLYNDCYHFKGHTRDHCYKLQCYPKRKEGGSSSHANSVATGGNHLNDGGSYDPLISRNTRFYVSSSSIPTIGTQAPGIHGMPFFTHEQYTCIISMLIKGKDVDTKPDVATTSTSVTVTTLMYDEVSNNYIVGTNASNYIIYNLSMMNNHKGVRD